MGIIAMLLLRLLGYGIGTCDAHTLSSSCNMTAYWNWYDDRFLSSLYGATLSRGPGQEVQSYREVRVKMQDGFWGILSTLSYPDCPPATACKAYLGNGQVMERAAQMCERALYALKTDRAGRHGDVDNYAIFGPMCSDECMDSDGLHLEAMAKSSCTCRDLSPAPPGHGHGGVLEEIAHWGVGAPWTWDGQGIVGYERLGPYRTEGEVCQRNSGRIMCRVLDRCGVWACRLGDFMCPRHEYNKQWTRFRGLGDCDAAAPLTARAAALAGALAGALLALYPG